MCCALSGHIKESETAYCCNDCLKQSRETIQPFMKITDKSYIRAHDLPWNILVLLFDAVGVIYWDEWATKNYGINETMDASIFIFKKFQEIDIKREYETKLIISFWINKTDIENVHILDMNICDMIIDYQFGYNRSKVFDPQMFRLTLKRYLHCQ